MTGTSEVGFRVTRVGQVVFLRWLQTPTPRIIDEAMPRLSEAMAGARGFVVVVYVTVAHRMIPFFTSSAMPFIQVWRPFWLLWLMLGAAAFEAAAVWVEFEGPLRGPVAPAWMLLRGVLDVLILSLPIAHPEIETVVLFADRFLVALPASHALARRTANYFPIPVDSTDCIFQPRLAWRASSPPLAK